MVLLTREQLLTIVGAALGAIWVEQRARRKVKANMWRSACLPVMTSQAAHWAPAQAQHAPQLQPLQMLMLSISAAPPCPDVRRRLMREQCCRVGTAAAAVCGSQAAMSQW